MKIYTKRGDFGETSLFGGDAFPKDYIRIEAYGTVDELNSILGCVSVALSPSALSQRIFEIQKQLFVLGSELACLHPSAELQKNFLSLEAIHQLEQDMDAWETELPSLKQFILPGGSPASASLHWARSVCRRAERIVVKLSHEEKLRSEVIQYLNRLSDWLFVLARLVNFREEISDQLWDGLLASKK